MKIIILDRTGHTEVQTQDVEEAIKELEKRMNHWTLAVVEADGIQEYLRDPQDLKDYAKKPDTQVYVMPQLQGG